MYNVYAELVKMYNIYAELLNRTVKYHLSDFDR